MLCPSEVISVTVAGGCSNPSRVRMGFGITPEQWRFYEVFGLFRNAVIAQQIYYRFFHGQTTNELYGLFGEAVRIVDRRIAELLR